MAVCQSCLLSQASLASGGVYLPCFLHDPQKPEKGEWEHNNAPSNVILDLIYSFGFKGDFYFYSPRLQISSTYWHKATTEISTNTDVNRPLCVALGPNLDWFFGYQAIDGQLKWISRREKGPDLKRGSFYRHWSSRQASYDKLETWLRTYAGTAIDMPQTRISLGPNGSYFASSPAGGVIWDGLPESFEFFFNPQHPGRVPTLLALGVKDTWFALWPDKSGSCNLGDDYPDLEKLLRKYGKGGIDYITLSASQPNQFVVSFRNNRSFIRGPLSEANLHQLNNIVAPSDEGSLQVQVCSLHNVSLPIKLPQPLLGVQKIRFPGGSDDRTGKHDQCLGKGEAAKAAGLMSEISSTCVVM